MKPKVLIVEDNPQHMRLLEMILHPRGYRLFKATDGEEALNVSIRERPDLIIMDIQLPKLSGLEVTRRLRENQKLGHIPIIAVTAYAMKGDAERVIQSGCDAYLSKPIDTRDLPRLVAELLPGHQSE